LAIGAFLILPLVVFEAIIVIDLLIGIGFLVLAGVLAYVPDSAPPRAGRRSINWPLLGVMATTSLPWLLYSFVMAGDHRDGLRYESCVDRITEQAALPLAMAVLPCAVALGWPSSRIPVWTAALSGGGFGVFRGPVPRSSCQPRAGWGAAAIAWAAVTLVAAEPAIRRVDRKGA